MTDIEKELKKVKFHLGWLTHEIGWVDRERTPISWLIIENDWDEDDLEKVHAIFEKHKNILQNSEDVNWNHFEVELYRVLEDRCPTVKSIILVFLRTEKHEYVCKRYAQAHMCLEFHEILESTAHDV